ncbi:TetR/AcrR family transcriptional regulator [Streptomyces sp. NPDC001595]|uniref:TetR/AcrR family transcriptional regulator n=1 Tax=Streptomyces sp. NPDC001532 TaxID=3154520 RepID=UPI00331CF305
MTSRERRQREQADRRQLILATAREMAEAEGWDSVTTRRLADRIEYSQPVLYQHFKNKDAIVRAVALDGFAELAAAMGAVRAAHDDPQDRLRAVARAYLGFAAANPTLYQAMFTLDVGLVFAREQTPQPLVDAFFEIMRAVEPVAGDRDPELLTEVLWSSWHGLANLTWGERLRPGLEEERLDALVDTFGGVAARFPA